MIITKQLISTFLLIQSKIVLKINKCVWEVFVEAPFKSMVFEKVKISVVKIMHGIRHNAFNRLNYSIFQGRAKIEEEDQTMLFLTSLPPYMKLWWLHVYKMWQ